MNKFEVGDKARLNHNITYSRVDLKNPILFYVGEEVEIIGYEWLRTNSINEEFGEYNVFYLIDNYEMDDNETWVSEDWLEKINKEEEENE